MRLKALPFSFALLVTLSLDVQAAEHAWNFAGIPYPTQPNSTLNAASGYLPWPYDPFTLATPEDPEAWPQTAVPGVYYVDPSHQTATDEENPFGTPRLPRRSPPPDGQYGPGTVMHFSGEFMDTSDTYKSDITYQFECTPDKPCWITGDAIFHSTHFNLGGSRYFFVEQLEFAHSYEDKKPLSFQAVANENPSVGSGTHHGVYRFLNIHDRQAPRDQDGAAIALSPGIHGGHNHNLIVYKTRVDGLGYQDGEPIFNWRSINPDVHAVSVVASHDDPQMYSVSNIWVIENELAHAAGHGFQCKSKKSNLGTPRITAHHIWIAGNDVHDNQEGGIWSKRCADIVISQNKSHGAHGPYAGGNNAGIGNEFGPDYFWVIFNEIYNNAQGFKRGVTSRKDAGDSDEGAGKHFLVGNLIRNNHDLANESFGSRKKKGGCIDLWQGNTYSYIVDNTCYDNDSGIRVFRGRFGDAYVAGNLIQVSNDPRDRSNAGSCVHIGSGFTRRGRGRIYNNLCNVGSWDFPGPMGNFAVNLSSRGKNNGKGVLGWVDPVNGNFDLAADSDALEGNVAAPWIDVYAMFESRYGISINRDYLGRQRVVGELKDIGAFERQLQR